MTVEAQQVEEQRETPRVLIAPEWVVMQNLFGGVGAGLFAWAWPRWMGGTFGDVTECIAIGVASFGAASFVRFFIDEIALLLRTIITQSMLGFKRAREWRERQRLTHDIRVCIAYADRLEKENAQLRAEVNVLKKKKTSTFEAPREPTQAEREESERWAEERRAAFDASYQELCETMGETPLGVDAEAGGVAPTLQLDESVEQCFADAGELLNHYEQFESLAKGNAYKNSGITNRQWDRGKQMLLDSGAARMEGNGLVLAVPTVLEADLLISQYREQLATQLHG